MGGRCAHHPWSLLPLIRAVARDICAPSCLQAAGRVICGMVMEVWATFRATLESVGQAAVTWASISHRAPSGALMLLALLLGHHLRQTRAAVGTTDRRLPQGQLQDGRRCAGGDSSGGRCGHRQNRARLQLGHVQRRSCVHQGQEDRHENPCRKRARS